MRITEYFRPYDITALVKRRKGMAANMNKEQTVPRRKGLGGDGNAGLAGLRLLMAEDNDINWKIISELLKSEGIASNRAENGRKCLEMLSRVPEGTFGLILMDVQMPVMDGLEAVKAIREDPRPAINSIPVIAMTADTLTEDVATCLDAGMDGHISKPVDIDMLLQEMRRVLGKRGR